MNGEVEQCLTWRWPWRLWRWWRWPHWLSPLSTWRLPHDGGRQPPPPSSNNVNHNERFTTAVAECEALARTHGHSLGRWHQLSKLMHASICVVCNEMTWVTQSGYGERWRSGGRVLSQDCWRRVESRHLGRKGPAPTKEC